MRNGKIMNVWGPADDDKCVLGITGFTGDPIVGGLQMMTNAYLGLPVSPVIPLWGGCRPLHS